MARRWRRSVSSLLWKRLAAIRSPAPTTAIIFTAQVTLFPLPFLPLLLLLSTLSFIEMLSRVGADSACDRTTDHPKCAFANELTAQ
jgi:hypothetical protein